MIRKSLINEIREKIDSHPFFVDDDFDFLEKKNKNNDALLNIIYKFNLDYSFKIKVPKTTSSIKVKGLSPALEDTRSVYIFRATQRPGFMVDDEKARYHGKEDFLSGINDWLNCVHSELLALPIYRELDKTKQQIDNIFKDFGDLPEEPFTAEEDKKLKGRLDSLEKQLAKNLQSQIDDKEELKEELNKLKQDIINLKNVVGSFDKKRWFGMFVVRVNNWLKDPRNQKVLKTGVDIAKSMIPESTENI